MKKNKISLVFLCSLLATGCNQAKFSEEWSFDHESHWHASLSNKSSEQLDFGKHDLGEAYFKDGEEYKKCSVCKKEIKLNDEEIEYSDDWSFDEAAHWHASLTEGSTKQADKADHEFGDIYLKDNEEYKKCVVCNKEVKYIEYSDDWSFDETTHWHASLKEGTNEKSAVARHTFGNSFVKNGAEMQACTVCDYEEEVDYQADFDVIELNKEISIHTEKQTEFLNYSGDYSTMDGSLYPDGYLTISDPLTQVVTWKYKNHNDKTIYSVSISQNKDMSNSFEIMGTNSQSLELYNFFVGKNYYRVNAYKDGGNVRVSSAVFQTTTDDVAPRNIYVGQNMTNCRDMGGRITESGAIINQGLLYRTCGSGYNMDFKRIDDEGIKILTKELKVKTEINVNDGSNYNYNISGINVFNTFCDYSNPSNPSKHHFSRNAESVKNVFEILANKENYPIAYHCRIGTDRTGLIAILVNGVLGVSLNNIYQDYLFSNFGKIGNKRYIGNKAGEDNIQVYMDEINAMPGENFQEKTYNTLLSIGVPAQTIEKVKDILLTGIKPNNDKGQIVKSVNDMEVTLAEVVHEPKTTHTERNNPEYYVNLDEESILEFDFEVKRPGTKEVYAYLGHENSTTAKTINQSVRLNLNGMSIQVPNTTFRDAGMGNCSGRVNYYFVKIGELEDLTEGSYTLKINGTTNSIKIGYVSIF